MSKKLNTLIAKAPTTPGIYKFLDKTEKVIYVGKAKSLRKRLQHYFHKSVKQGTKTVTMLSHAEGVEWVETNNEVEALILEDNLIKTLQPKYNILLKDDKHFQYIKVTVQDDYPFIYTVRRITKDGARYFGPKTSGTDVKRIMESVKKIFKLCSVRGVTLNSKGEPLKGAKVAVKVGGTAAKRPCLDYHIKRCTGPCAGMVTPKEYQEQVGQALEFLSGKYKAATEVLKNQMKEYAAAKKFERAAAVRDHITSIERSAQKQLITDTGLPERDVIAYVEDLGKNYFVLFQIRAGKLINQEKFISEGGELPVEIMEAFLREYYGLAADIPKEIIVSVLVDEKKLIETYISQQTTHKVKIIHPQAGKKDDLVMLAEKNARSFAEQSRVRWMAEARKGEAALKELQKALKLKNIPKRIECYDISHLSGTETVGSMVVFKKGEPANGDYRQFRLRTTVDEIDDYKSMKEVLTRRLSYIPTKLPDVYKIMKAKKKDQAFLEEVWPHLDDIEHKQFYIIMHNKKIVAIGRIRVISDKVHELNALWVDQSERGKKLGHFILQKLIDTSKQKRLYLFCDMQLEEYYLKMGFENIHKPPKEMEATMKRIAEHAGKDFNPLYLAYQKKKKDFSFTATPDLIVIDGGKGQLHVAHDVLFEKGLKIPIISLAKKHEEVFIPGKSEPISLAKDTEASYLLQCIRDEAHRFAIEFNRSSRDKKMTQSALDKIPGIGPKMKKRLLTHFGSVHKIREASEIQLQQIAGTELGSRIKETL